MEDPVLNKSLEETRELQTRWSQFRDFCRMAYERKNVPPEAEMKFLELKSIIAMLHDGFMAKLDHDQKTGQAIMSIVGETIMLGRVAHSNEAERQKFEFDWNECYMLLNEQITVLEEEQERLAGISERAWKAAKKREAFKAAVYNFIHGAFLKYTIILAIIILFVYVIPTFIWSYRNLREIPGISTAYVKTVNLIVRPLSPITPTTGGRTCHASSATPTA